MHSSARKQGAAHACSSAAPHTDIVILWIKGKNSDAEEKKSLKSLLLFSLSEMCFRQHVNTELIPLSHLPALEIHTQNILSKLFITFHNFFLKNPGNPWLTSLQVHYGIGTRACTHKHTRQKGCFNSLKLKERICRDSTANYFILFYNTLQYTVTTKHTYTLQVQIVLSVNTI